MRMIERFWDKVDKTNSCWLWTGAICRGYGIFNYMMTPQGAHRVSWKITNGEIPEGLYLCHICDVRRCVNPKHLFLGTAKDNYDDAVVKGRIIRDSKGRVLSIA